MGRFADLSGQYQPDVSLDLYRQAGYDTLAHKVSEGVTFTDPRIGVRWQAMRNLGLHRVAYHMLRGTSAPGDQAHHFLDVLDRSGGIAPDDVFALDFEMPDASNGGALQWLRTIRDALPAQRLLLYSGNWYLLPHGLRYSDLPERVGYWLSAYVPQSQMLRYLAPGWPSPCAWQYTDAAPVSGLGSAVDCSQQLCDLQHLYPGSNSNRFSGFRTLRVPTHDPIYDRPLPNVPYAPADYPVHALQYSYNVLFGTTLLWDGVYGPATATATENFQRDHGLAVDGIVGPVTWAALDAAADARGM